MENLSPNTRTFVCICYSQIHLLRPSKEDIFFPLFTILETVRRESENVDEDNLRKHVIKVLELKYSESKL